MKNQSINQTYRISGFNSVQRKAILQNTSGQDLLTYVSKKYFLSTLKSRFRFKTSGSAFTEPIILYIKKRKSINQ